MQVRTSMHLICFSCVLLTSEVSTRVAVHTRRGSVCERVRVFWGKSQAGLRVGCYRMGSNGNWPETK